MPAMATVPAGASAVAVEPRRAAALAVQLAGLVVLGGAAVFSAAERLAFIGRDLAPSLPLHGPYRFEKAAFAALSEGNLPAADAFARRAILAGPVEASASSLLGTVALQAGNETLVQSAFRVGAQLGWRDVPVQAWIATQAQVVGDVRVMAERLDAMLRVGTPYAQIAPALAAIEKMPGGAEAMAVRLGYSPAWRAQYLGSLETLSDADLDSRMRIAKSARARGLALDCEAIGQSTFKLSQARRARMALRLWQNLECGVDDPHNLAKAAGGFEETDIGGATGMPFRWIVESQADGEATLDVSPDSNGHALFVRGTGAKQVTVARRMIVLAPGNYMLRWKAIDGSRRPSAAVGASVACSISYAPLVPAGTMPVQTGTQFTLAFAVPPANCDAQILQVNAQGNKAVKDGGWIDDIEVVPVR